MIFYSLICCFFFVLLRLVYLLLRVNVGRGGRSVRSASKRTGKVKTMIVLGSGGHTAEMLEIVKELNIERYAPRFYVIATTDTQSILKLIDVEVEKEPAKEKHSFEIIAITRSREVKQSYWTAIFSTCIAMFKSIVILVRTRPELILTNGPGTCVPICLVAFWLKIFFINRKCQIVYVESYCRVKTLSLSGKLLLSIADLFVAQWPEVAALSKKIDYLGRLF